MTYMVVEGVDTEVGSEVGTEVGSGAPVAGKGAAAAMEEAVETAMGARAEKGWAGTGGGAVERG